MASRTGPQITIARKSGAAALLKRMVGLGRLAAYVGVPASGRDARTEQLLAMSGKTTSKKKKAKLKKSAQSDVTNAELLFIHTNGSPINKIPPRPVIQPAIAADGNRQAISNEIGKSIKANLDGNKEEAENRMLRAAIAGQNAARTWFTDPRNGWAPNKVALRAAEAKGLVGDAARIEALRNKKPLIDTGAMRASIVGVVREE